MASNAWIELASDVCRTITISASRSFLSARTVAHNTDMTTDGSVSPSKVANTSTTDAPTNNGVLITFLKANTTVVIVARQTKAVRGVLVGKRNADTPRVAAHVSMKLFTENNIPRGV